MSDGEPVAELQTQFSSPGARATAWKDARALLQKAQVYWISTVREGGRPHVTPMVAVFLDDSLYFSTGPQEQKAKNLEHSVGCVVTTGCNTFEPGMDLVLEGDAKRVGDSETVRRVAEAFSSKYEPPFDFTARDGVLVGEGGDALLFELSPVKAFGYGKGDTFSATRWRF